MPCRYAVSSGAASDHLRSSAFTLYANRDSSDGRDALRGFWRAAFGVFRILCIISCLSLTKVAAIDMDICKERSCYPATGNLLIGREHLLQASSTCGLKTPQRYCVISHLAEKKKCFQCDSSQAWQPYPPFERSHRISNIVTDRFENRIKKWWQSESGAQNVSVRLDLEAEFHFTHLVMTFRSFRPAAMVIERSSDFGLTWKVYRYFAYDCEESFPGVPVGAPKRHTDVICDSRYSAVEPSSLGEVVFKVLSPHILLGDPYAAEIQDLLRVTNIRINFTKLHTLGDNLLDNRPEIAEKYYYAIYDMVVRGSCSCYGHASRCIPDGLIFKQGVRPEMVHGRCECTHFTKGLNCEECDDFYNDAPWGPAVDKDTHACRRCNCHDHATRCHFDRAVYEASGYQSGGVCDDCMHNTMGKNCHECKPYYYRDPGLELNNPYICRPCECDLRGSLNQGICESETDSGRNLVAGRCKCKVNVDTERCDRCKHGFWNLDQDNPDGCTPCTCYLLGTVGNEGCNKYTGECNCKRLVTGENCDRCLPEHWGLGDSPEGCKPCDCDVGGAINNNCDTLTGQCLCRQHFTGRRCDEPESGFYCANLDHYLYEAETARLEGPTKSEQREYAPDGYSTWTGTGFARVREGSVIVFDVGSVSIAMNYHVVIRYELSARSAWQNVQVKVIRPGPIDPNGPCNLHPLSDDDLRTTLYPGAPYTELYPTICLEAGVRYQIRVTFGESQVGFPDRAATLLVDSLILVPPTDALSIFSDGSELATYRRHEYNQYQCRHSALALTNLDRLSDVCKKYVCPVAASLLDRGVQCDCDRTGVESSICEPKGGQCKCKQNVIGRRCDQCAPGKYGFGPQGCSSCECSSVGSLDNFCDLHTGHCRCHEGVYGRQCDLCQSGYWGFPDCRPCECNGHADTCSQENGTCIECRDLTDGQHCERCRMGYYGDPRSGINYACKPCPCPGGPGSGYQHAATCYLDYTTENVVCNCELGYEGSRCDKCISNYWGNPSEIGGTCERCDCNKNINFDVPESCDAKTGRCLKCLYNTEGFQCEHCKPGFYGDAKTQSCQRCVCNRLGTDDAAGPCDRATGQCHCLPNVKGLQCDTCADNHWKLDSGTGCEACNCDPMGVESGSDGQPILQCNLFDGQCTCKPGRGGRTCSECENLFWGDPRVECKACECNRVGSESLQCHRDNGTCVCREGSGGDKCDQCARGFKGQWPYCQACGECFQSWDRILQGLKEDTKRLIDQASGVEDTGVTSIYDAEFKEMEKKLADVQEKLNTANITRKDVDMLREQIKNLEKQITDARARLNNVDGRITQISAAVYTAEVAVDSLRKEAERLAAATKDLEQNATQLRQIDVVGAYNLTREALYASETAQRQANRTANIISQSEELSRATKQKLQSNQNDFHEQFSQNEAALSTLSSQLERLTGRMPNLNEMVCGAKGYPCHDLCGGAGCGKCGGTSCSEGASTKSDLALSYAQEAHDKLSKKQAEAHDVLQRVEAAQSDSEKALLEARQAYETALSVSKHANQTRQTLEDLHQRMTEFIDRQHTTPQEIRIVANDVMNTTISLSPDQIGDLARQINQNLQKLTRIDDILAETRGNLTLAQRLKSDADDAKAQAESVLNTTKSVLEALVNATNAQDAATRAIKIANADIEAAGEDLKMISQETEIAEGLVNESTEKLTKLKVDVNSVNVNYLEIRKDVERGEAVAKEAKRKAQAAQTDSNALNEMYVEAEATLKRRAGSAEGTKDRAANLKQKATKLLEKTKKYIDDIEDERKRFDSNDLNLFENSLNKLHEELDGLLVEIQQKLVRYETCDHPPEKKP